jgi:putative 4-mercaptohistidine N1-methyltranferase
MSHSYYEKEKAAQQYLLFHYGREEEVLPFPFSPKNSLHFPVRCVTECVDFNRLPANARALEIGCSVGRSSFELSRHCGSVLAIDNSERFISLAKRLQQGEIIEYTMREEASATSPHKAQIPSSASPERIEFKCADALQLNLNGNTFDLVLCANLLCRLPKPRLFLQNLANWVAPDGQLILISPYSWQEEYTSKSEWPDSNGTFEWMHTILKEHFVLRKRFEMPFLIREHRRKYEWGVSEATLWTRSRV